MIPTTSSIMDTGHQEKKPALTAADFKYNLEQVIETQESFDEGLLMDDRNPEDARFALATIKIADVLDNNGNPLAMTDQMIEDNNDVEYIQAMIEVARKQGKDCFPPIVVLDRATHFEWLDGQHRVTALHRAGFTTTSAYIQLGDF